MTPATQITLLLTRPQLAKVNKRLQEKKKIDAYAKKADVLREILDAGLEALDEK